MRNPQEICCLCFRQARGHGVQPLFSFPRDKRFGLRKSKGPKFKPPQTYWCCSLDCSDAVLKLVQMGNNKLPNQEYLTQMEDKAIKDAKADLWQAIVEMGLADKFKNEPEIWTDERIEFMIYRIWLGVRKSMMLQSGQGEVPF